MSSGFNRRPFMQRMLRAFLLVLATAAGLAAVTHPAPIGPEHTNVEAQYWPDPSGNAALEVAQAAFEAKQGRPADAINVDQWPMPYLYPAFALTVQPGETQATYLRIQNSHPVRVIWQLQEAASFSRRPRHGTWRWARMSA